MDFINADAVLELLDKRTEEMTTAAAVEERKAAGNITIVNRLRFAAKVVTDIRNEIGLMLAKPGEPDTEALALDDASCLARIMEECPPNVNLDEIARQHGFTPEENSMDPLYGDFVADTMTPDPEPDTTPPNDNAASVSARGRATGRNNKEAEGTTNELETP